MASKRDTIKDSDRFSIITDNFDSCYICGSGVCNIHEIFHGVANRTKSKNDGLTLPLCKSCHQGQQGVHNNPILDEKLKVIGEKYWIDKYTDSTIPYEERIEIFIDRYGRNYIL